MAYNCPADIVLVIDESGSMRGSRQGTADQVFQAFINKMGPNMRIGVVEFDTSARKIADYAYQSRWSSGEVDRIVSETGAAGGTRLYRGFETAATQFPLSGNRPKYVIAITDVNNDGSNFDFAVGIGVLPNYGRGGNYNVQNSPTLINDAVDDIYKKICPSPVDVLCTFNTVIKLNGKNFTPPNNNFTPAGILLNGSEIGKGNVSKNLLQESKHTVTFTKPSHPDYEFSEAKPDRINITVPYNGGTYTAYFEATEVQRAYLTIKTTYDPDVLDVNDKAEILLNGSKPLNIALPDDPDIKTYVVGTGETAKMRLLPGIYTISFKDISISGMIYKTPKPFTIELKHRDDIVRTLNFEGRFLPKSYWLKPFDDIEKQTIHTTTTVGMFSNNISNLTSFHTSSINSTVDQYYKHVYQESISSLTSSIQFSIAYGHRLGYGSNDEGGQVNDTPTRAIYSQYRNILLNNSTGSFRLTGDTTDHIYVITYQKDRRDTRCDFRDLEINIAHLSGSEFVAGGGSLSTHTGSNVQLSGDGSVTRLISSWHASNLPYYDYGGSYYNIISGSIEDGVYSSSNIFGRFYPNHGVVLLDANKLDDTCSFATTAVREIDGQNTHKLFTAISGAALLTDASGDYLGMKARATKDEVINYYHINVRNKEFNYTNNPSYYDLDSGEIVSDFINKPSTYATTIGLYDENRNLLAVAKTSVPEYKSFVDEVMLNVKLKY